MLERRSFRGELWRRLPICRRSGSHLVVHHNVVNGCIAGKVRAINSDETVLNYTREGTKVYLGQLPLIALITAKTPDLGPVHAIKDFEAQGAHVGSPHVVPEIDEGVLQAANVDARAENDGAVALVNRHRRFDVRVVTRTCSVVA